MTYLYKAWIARSLSWLSYLFPLLQATDKHFLWLLCEQWILIFHWFNLHHIYRAIMTKLVHVLCSNFRPIGVLKPISWSAASLVKSIDDRPKACSFLSHFIHVWPREPKVSREATCVPHSHLSQRLFVKFGRSVKVAEVTGSLLRNNRFRTITVEPC